MSYLTRWGMHLAASLLRSTEGAVRAVAAQVGYASEAAFNKVFKRCFGLPPSAYCRAHIEQQLVMC